MSVIRDKKLLAASLALWSGCALGAGSMVLDNTLAGQTQGVIPLIGGTYTIPASQGAITGSGNALNLFHSFQTFNVSAGETALFTNDTSNASANFANIISRVTGGTPSTINGTIDSSAFPKANFWFVNPAGVTIEAGAKIDVPAGLAIGSADYISFADGDRWYAIDSNGTAANPSVLATASPSAFGFLPGTRNLVPTTSPGGSGAVSVNAGGPLNLTDIAVGGAGNSVLINSAGDLTLVRTAIDTSSAAANENSGNVTISSSGNVDVESSNFDTSSAQDYSQGGVISIQGGGIRVVGSTLNAGYSGPDLSSYDFQGPGTISIATTGVAAAGSPSLVDTGTPQAGTVFVGTSSLIDSTSNGINGLGPITLSGGDVVLGSGASILSTAEGQAASPGITVIGAGGVWLAGANVSESAQADAVYGGPGVQISGGRLGITLSKSTVENIDSSINGPSSVSAVPPVAVSLSASTGPITIESSSTIASGNGPPPIQGEGGFTNSSPAGAISVEGNSVAIHDSTIDSSTINAADAGSISVAATGSTGMNGEAAVSIDAASTLQSDATQGTLGYVLSTQPITLLRVPNSGQISISAPSGTVQVSGGSILRTSAGLQAGQAGTISISGAQLALTEAQLLTSVATQSTSGSLDAQLKPIPLVPGSIALNALGRISLTGTLLDARTSGAVDAGSVSVTGASVDVNGGELSAATKGSGNAGPVAIVATGADVGSTPALLIEGGALLNSIADSGTSSSAHAGTVTLEADHGTAEVIGTLGDQQLGTTLSTSAGSGAGAAGQVSVTGTNVALDGADLKTTVNSAQSGLKAATITLTATSGNGLLTVNDSTLTADTTGASNAGDIVIIGNSVSIDPTKVSTSTSSTGNAGNIKITAAGALDVTGATIESQSQSPAPDAGPAGSISLVGAPVVLEGGSIISATITGGVSQVSGGIPTTPTSNILIDPAGPHAGILISDSKVTTQADVANGGDINILASSGPVAIKDGSVIKASAGQGIGTTALGTGGNITIGPKQSGGGPTSIVVQGSQILAQADGGRGGAIYIGPAPGHAYIQDVASRVNADSNAGTNGTVTIKAPQTDLNSALKPAQVSAAKAPVLSADVCAPGVNRSTFVRVERGGISSAPDGYLARAFSGDGVSARSATAVSAQEGAAPRERVSTGTSGLTAANLSTCR